MSMFAPGIITKDFTPGTSSKIEIGAAIELIANGLRSSRPQVNPKTIAPIYAMEEGGEYALENELPKLVGFEVVHAEPVQRKPRSDKGKSKPRKEASSDKAAS